MHTSIAVGIGVITLFRREIVVAQTFRSPCEFFIRPKLAFL